MFLERDHLFKENTINTFKFDNAVGNKFQDMLYRSIPDYSNLQKIILYITREYAKDNSIVLDLGCSQGNTLLGLRKNLEKTKVKVYGIDNSEYLCDIATKRLGKQKSSIPYKIFKQSIEDPFEISENISVIISSLTLHFLEPSRRASVLQKCYEKLANQGCFILIEKTEIDKGNEIYSKIHEKFRKENLYTNTEIKNKKRSLKNTLYPVKNSETEIALKEIGFNKVDVFWKWCEFVGIIAIK